MTPDICINCRNFSNQKCAQPKAKLKIATNFSGCTHQDSFVEDFEDYLFENSQFLFSEEDLDTLSDILGIEVVDADTLLFKELKTTIDCKGDFIQIVKLISSELKLPLANIDALLTNFINRELLPTNPNPIVQQGYLIVFSDDGSPVESIKLVDIPMTDLYRRLKNHEHPDFILHLNKINSIKGATKNLKQFIYELDCNQRKLMKNNP